MAKKTAKKEAPKKAAEKQEFKYSMSDLAEATGQEPRALRQKLRTAGFEKSGGAWGWNNKTDFNAAATAVKPKAEPKAKKGKKAKADADE